MPVAAFQPVPRAPRSARRSLIVAAILLALGLLAAPAASAARAASASPKTTTKPTTTAPTFATGPVNSRGPLLWTVPAIIDVRPIDAISCPSATLCVVADRGGYVLWSTDPAGGPSAWGNADVDGTRQITAISCPSTTLCVAVDAAGDVITSQAPTGGAAAWTVTDVDKNRTQNNTDNGGAVLLRGISCPSITLCVAVDAVGDAIVSTDPPGGAAAWTAAQADPDPSFGCTAGGLTCQPPLVGVACPSIALCVAVDNSGNILTTTTPTTPGQWATTPTNGGALTSLYGLSCPLTTFCAAVNGIAGQVITFSPASPATQQLRSLTDPLYGIWCQSSNLCVGAAQTPGGISGLLGSYDPAALNATWSLSSLGGVNAVACPLPVFCVAADDEGNVSAGLATTDISSSLTTELLTIHHPPTTAALVRLGRETFSFTSPIAGQVQLVWTIKQAGSVTPTVLATAGAALAAPGTATVSLPLTAMGRQLLQAATRRVTLTATATFSADTGSVVVSRHLAFKIPPKPKPKPKPKHRHKPRR
jgi:hypothetical protein